jgi:predicted nucleotidyltransferase
MIQGTHAEFSRRGGKARSAAKTAANRAKASAFWRDVRSGRRPSPRRRRARLTPEVLSGLLSDCCRRRGVTRLDAFGQGMRNGCADGPITLLATVSGNDPRRVAALRAEMADLLGRPIELLTRDGLDQIANPFRRLSILADATPIYVG